MTSYLKHELVSTHGPFLAGHVEVDGADAEAGEVVSVLTMGLVVETQSEPVVASGEGVVGMDTEHRQIRGMLEETHEEKMCHL